MASLPQLHRWSVQLSRQFSSRRGLSVDTEWQWWRWLYWWRWDHRSPCRQSCRSEHAWTQHKSNKRLQKSLTNRSVIMAVFIVLINITWNAETALLSSLSETKHMIRSQAFLYFLVTVVIFSSSPERQSAQMSKITNESLTQSGTGCFIPVTVWQQ